MPLHWQSRAVLLLALPAAAVYALTECLGPAPARTLAAAALASLALAALVLAARAATVSAALAGALLAFCYGVTPSPARSPLWLLALSLTLTLGASRVGRARKQAQAAALGGEEEKHSRTAAQVAANLGVAALAGTAINAYGEVLAHAALVAALAEATADTLASELGRLAPGRPRMLLTLRPAEPGTDGAVSLFGTAAGIAGALLIALAARPVLALPWSYAMLGAGCGVAGLFLDSMLGELVERRGWLHNDAVNFLSTLFSALLALGTGRLLP